MKILAIADEESKYLWDYFDKSKIEGIDLIISCGDLNPHYLSFLVTLSSVPVLYVHGNHDGKYENIPPEGCTCIDDEILCPQRGKDSGAGRFHALQAGAAPVHGMADAPEGGEAEVQAV